MFRVRRKKALFHRARNPSRLSLVALIEIEKLFVQHGKKPFDFSYENIHFSGILLYNLFLYLKKTDLSDLANLSKDEIILWKQLKGKQRKGFDFDRQRVIGNFIVDFYVDDTYK